MQVNFIIVFGKNSCTFNYTLIQFGFSPVINYKVNRRNNKLHVAFLSLLTSNISLVLIVLKQTYVHFSTRALAGVNITTKMTKNSLKRLKTQNLKTFRRFAKGYSQFQVYRWWGATARAGKGGARRKILRRPLQYFSSAPHTPPPDTSELYLRSPQHFRR